MKDNNNQEVIYSSIDELLKKAREANNHRIQEFNINRRSTDKNSKGALGEIMQEGLFHIPANSRPEPDFKNLGVEFKVTGLKMNKNKSISMKERLVLNVISYKDEANATFEESSFWRKNSKLLIMFYLYDSSITNRDYLIMDSFIHTFSNHDLAIIKKDWEIIHKKIIEGKAHTISEGDTMYLGACVKGSGQGTFRTQPFSDVLAQQRAYCLKASYLNTIVREYFNKEKLTKLFGNDIDLTNYSFEYQIISMVKEYFGLCVEELFKKFNVKKSKTQFYILSKRMLGVKTSLNEIEEFEKANIKLRAVRVLENGRIKESTSFPAFDFKEIVNQEWEESDFYNEVTNLKTLFFVYRMKNNEYYFDDVFIWNMPYIDIEKYCKPVFEITKKVIANGEIVKEFKNGKFKTNFPGMKFNRVCHVRSHDQLGILKTNRGGELPAKDNFTGFTRYTKHCFWLDSRYIAEVIKNHKKNK